MVVASAGGPARPARITRMLLSALSAWALAACGSEPTEPVGAGLPADTTAPASPFVSVAAGEAHSCAVRQSGQVECWGRNRSGQVGEGSWGTEPVLRPTPVAQGGIVFSSVDAGREHTCALTAGREIWCWGSDRHRQLGYMTADPLEDCGGAPCSTFPRSVIDGTRFRTFATGGTFTCAGTSLGTLYCWGDNRLGQAGTGGVNDMRPYAWPVFSQDLFEQVEAGADHACAVTLEGRTFCWGRGDAGQVGVAPPCSEWYPACPEPAEVVGGADFVGLALGGDHSCGWWADGRAACWGDDRPGAAAAVSRKVRASPAEVPLPAAALLLAAGGGHTCAVVEGGEAYCWGDNARGQLGTGTRTDATEPERVAGGHRFVHLAAGKAHTCGATTEGTVLCWGANDEGQVGDGSRADALEPLLVAGG